MWGTIRDHLIYTLSLGNGGSSGVDYSFATLAKFLPAALRTIQHQRIGRDFTVSLLSGLSFRCLLFLFTAFSWFRLAVLISERALLVKQKQTI
jgi:hypothetical protein